MTFGRNLQPLRTAKYRLSKDFAAALGVKPGIVSRWERDKTGPPAAKTLIRIAILLDCTIDALLDGVRGYTSRDLARHDRDQQFGTSAHVGDPNEPAAARVFALTEENHQLRIALEKITDVASELVQIAKAGVEVHSAADDGSGGGDRD